MQHNQKLHDADYTGDLEHKPRRCGGARPVAVAPGAWIGNGRARANSTDIARAMWLYLIAGFLGVAPLALLALLLHRF